MTSHGFYLRNEFRSRRRHRIAEAPLSRESGRVRSEDADLARATETPDERISTLLDSRPVVVRTSSLGVSQTAHPERTQ